MTPNDALLETREVTAYLRISRSQVFRLLRKDATFARPVRVGRRTLRWKKADLDQWMAGRQS